MTTFDEFLAGVVSDSINARQPCGPFCTVACRDARPELHGGDLLDRRLANQLREESRLDIADDGPEVEPATYSGNQGNADLRAVQLRPENFSPAMVEKAGRLYVERSWGPYPAMGDVNSWDIRGDSGEVYPVRCWGKPDGPWFATCPCPARASRWNKAGACAHRALAGYLRALYLGQDIPRWPALDLAEVTS